MDDVKPWEPVKARMQDPFGWFSAFSDSRIHSWALNARNGWRLHVTLANGQCIIVRAKS